MAGKWNKLPERTGFPLVFFYGPCHILAYEKDILVIDSGKGRKEAKTIIGLSTSGMMCMIVTSLQVLDTNTEDFLSQIPLTCDRRLTLGTTLRIAPTCTDRRNPHINGY